MKKSVAANPTVKLSYLTHKLSVPLYEHSINIYTKKE